ncbi:MAG: 30S ribosomal protein S6 [Saprospiraceae bacterium]|nr:30S ribosomal protein S6 [Saprospiraceae bacterium]
MSIAPVKWSEHRTCGRDRLRQLAYEIKAPHRYYYVSSSSGNHAYLSSLELNMRRDESLLRFHHCPRQVRGKVHVDKRGGLIGKTKKKSKADLPTLTRRCRSGRCCTKGENRQGTTTTT